MLAAAGARLLPQPAADGVDHLPRSVPRALRLRARAPTRRAPRAAERPWCRKDLRPVRPGALAEATLFRLAACRAGRKRSKSRGQAGAFSSGPPPPSVGLRSGEGETDSERVRLPHDGCLADSL